MDSIASFPPFCTAGDLAMVIGSHCFDLAPERFSSLEVNSGNVFRLTMRALYPPTSYAGVVMVGPQPVGTVCAFSGTLHGLKLVPSKWRCLVPPTSTPEGAYPQGASRTAAVGQRLQSIGEFYQS